VGHPTRSANAWPVLSSPGLLTVLTYGNRAADASIAWGLVADSIRFTPVKTIAGVARQ
jgi:hypothetical protein